MRRAPAKPSALACPTAQDPCEHSFDRPLHRLRRGRGGRRRTQAPQTYKGLEVSVAGVDACHQCEPRRLPPGRQHVRGVIKPGDTIEFASVKVDFKVLPAFKPGVLPKPVLYDEAGKAYNTAQSFGDIGAAPAFACTFSFRVPKGAKVTSSRSTRRRSRSARWASDGRPGRRLRRLVAVHHAVRHFGEWRQARQPR